MGLLEFIGQIGGIAGVMAVIMFLIYRQDRKASEDRVREDRKFMEDRMMRVLEDYNEASINHSNMLSQFKDTLNELIIWLKRSNGKT